MYYVVYVTIDVYDYVSVYDITRGDLCGYVSVLVLGKIRELELTEFFFGHIHQGVQPFTSLSMYFSIVRCTGNRKFQHRDEEAILLRESKLATRQKDTICL